MPLTDCKMVILSALRLSICSVTHFVSVRSGVQRRCVQTDDCTFAVVILKRVIKPVTGRLWQKVNVRLNGLEKNMNTDIASSALPVRATVHPVMAIVAPVGRCAIRVVVGGGV